MRLQSWVLVLVCLTGCRLTVPDDRFACSRDLECPPDFACVSGFCRRGATPDDAGVDDLDSPAPGIDVWLPDAPGLDAPLPDVRLPAPDAWAGDAAAPPGTDAACVARSCLSAAAECGELDDLCGETLDCGPCSADSQCRDNVCVPCEPPLSPAACADDSTCGPGQVCAAGVCLDHCGDPAGTRARVANLRAGVAPVLQVCTYVGLGGGRPTTRDGCATHDLFIAIATSPTPTSSSVFVQQLSLESPTVPPVDVASWTTEHSSSSYPTLSAQLAVSPSGRFLLTGWGLDGTEGELIAIDLETRELARSTAPGLVDAVWLDDTSVLAITSHSAGGPAVHWMPRPGLTGTVMRVVTGFGPLGAGLERVAEPGMRGTLLVGGRMTSSPSRLYAVEESSFLDASLRPTASVAVLDTSSVTNVLPVRRVGPWVVSAAAAGGAIERRRFVASPFALPDRADVYIGGTGQFGRVDDEHIVIPLASGALVARLPD